MLITHQRIDLNGFLLQKPGHSCGATSYFVGWVRNHHLGKKVTRLFYECYRPLAEKEMETIVREGIDQTGVDEIRVIHRVGLLEIGEAAVAVWASAAHREAAFQACQRTIDEIKKRVPIWKKEFYEDQSNQWVSCAHEVASP